MGTACLICIIVRILQRVHGHLGNTILGTMMFTTTISACSEKENACSAPGGKEDGIETHTTTSQKNRAGTDVAKVDRMHMHMNHSPQRRRGSGNSMFNMYNCEDSPASPRSPGEYDPWNNDVYNNNFCLQ